MKHQRSRRLPSILLPAILMLGMISILSASAATPPLHFIQARYDNLGLKGAISVAISPDDKHVYVASEAEDALTVLSRDSLNGSLKLVEVERDGVGGVDGLNAAWSVVVSPDGEHVYVAGRDDSAVAVFSRNPASGALAFLEMEKQGVDGVDGISGAVGVDISPDGDYVYVAGFDSDAIAWFEQRSREWAVSAACMVLVIALLVLVLTSALADRIP